MNCPKCDSNNTRVTDTRYYPTEAETEAKKQALLGLKDSATTRRRKRKRWLDIPADTRAHLPPGSQWRRRCCQECGTVFSTAEVILRGGDK